MAQAFFGGVHPHDMKAATNEKAIEQLAPPAEVVIPMSMHFGAPCTPLVKAGDLVKVGQKIGEFRGLGAPIHASVSGKVKAVEPRPYSMGGNITSVIIENDFQNTLSEEVQAPSNPDTLTPDEMVEIVKNAGIVGMGGATFPTHVKISGGIGKVDTVIINGAECEPYITSDTRTMIDDADNVIYGAQLLQKYYTADRIVIGIEDNKPQCVKIMEEAGKGVPGFEVASLPALYPQGGEKVLIYNTTGEIVPEGKLPIDVGAIVINCTTLAVIAKYIKTGMPLVEKVVTVDGSAVANPQNVIVPVGTPIQNVLDFVGLKCEPKKVLYGGPMMGTSVPSLEAPVMKNTNAILAFDEKDAEDPVPSACIRCGRCVAHCPFNLMPAAIEAAYNNKEPEKLKALKVNLCMECGCCSFSCPARRPLVQVNKLAKAMLNQYNAEQKAAAEKKAAKEKEKEAV